MIEAIVARIYYKILTIENIFLIGRAAICSLFLYVIVGWSVFGPAHPKKDLQDWTNESSGRFQCHLRLVRIRAIVGV